jgi:hypothetical protein
MHKVRVVRSYYDQSEPHVGKIGEVIGHWGPDNTEDGRDGFMVQVPDGTIIGFTENEVEPVSDDAGEAAGSAGSAEPVAGS